VLARLWQADGLGRVDRLQGSVRYPPAHNPPYIVVECVQVVSVCVYAVSGLFQGCFWARRHSLESVATRPHARASLPDRTPKAPPSFLFISPLAQFSGLDFFVGIPCFLCGWAFFLFCFQSLRSPPSKGRGRFFVGICSLGGTRCRRGSGRAELVFSNLLYSRFSGVLARSEGFAHLTEVEYLQRLLTTLLVIWRTSVL